MIDSNILIASAVAAVIMMSGVKSQCTIPLPDGRVIQNGTQTNNLSNCSAFYRCHFTILLTLSCDSFNRFFDPCQSECQSNEAYCFRTDCNPASSTPSSTSESTSSSSASESTSSSSASESTSSSPASESSSSSSDPSTVPAASTPGETTPTPPIIVPVPPTTNGPTVPCTDIEDAACCCNPWAVGSDCPIDFPDDVECCCNFDLDPNCKNTNQNCPTGKAAAGTCAKNDDTCCCNDGFPNCGTATPAITPCCCDHVANAGCLLTEPVCTA